MLHCLCRLQYLNDITNCLFYIQPTAILTVLECIKDDKPTYIVKEGQHRTAALRWMKLNGFELKCASTEETIPWDDFLVRCLVMKEADIGNLFEQSIKDLSKCLYDVCLYYHVLCAYITMFLCVYITMFYIF